MLERSTKLSAAKEESPLRLIGLGLGGFIATAAALHMFVKHPLALYAPQRTEKLQVLARTRGPITAATFGTSHIHNGFDPRAFDRAMAGGPFPVRTLNLGIEGGSQIEQSVMAKKFLDERAGDENAARSDYLVLLELNAGVNFTPQHMFTPRVINIYDADATKLTERFADAGVPAAQRAGRLGYAVAARALHQSNVGMLSNAIFNPPLAEDELRSETENDRRGLLAAPPRPKEHAKVVSLLAGRPPVPEAPPGAVTGGHRFLLETLDRGTRPPNVHFAFIVTPAVADVYARKTYPKCIETPFGKAPIFDVADPQAHPELYSAALWSDPVHLNEQGAAVFSRLIGDQARQWYAGAGANAACGTG